MNGLLCAINCLSRSWRNVRIRHPAQESDYDRAYKDKFHWKICNVVFYNENEYKMLKSRFDRKVAKRT